ncbi:MAG TPA: glycosyltransferase family 4 protein [Actinomycetota bacterium]|nr:glycosyltransferase family 4 protein [Actinomycetota bacterium]
MARIPAILDRGQEDPGREVRIALVCPYAWDRPGGVQSHVRSLATALVDAGHDVAVVAPTSGRPSASPGANAFNLTTVGRTVPVPANGSVAPIAFGPRVAARTRSALDEFGADVVHAHEPLIPSVSLLAVRASKQPVVGTFHASTDSSLGYAAAQPWLRREVNKIARRTAVSEAALSLAARYFPGDYDIVPNGINVARFAGATPLDLGDKKTILFLGRLEKRKGLEILIQTVASLRDLDPKLVVVGRGPREKPAKALARKLRIDAEWVGAVDDDTIPRLYKSVDVFAAPNLGGESFGIVLLEAMAAGAPLVCSDLDAFVDVAGDAALVAKRNDSRALAAALRAALTGGPVVKGRVEAGRKRVEQFDWPVLVRDLESVYEQAAQG